MIWHNKARSLILIWCVAYQLAYNLIHKINIKSQQRLLPNSWKYKHQCTRWRFRLQFWRLQDNVKFLIPVSFTMRTACHRNIVRSLGRVKQRHILQQEQPRLRQFLKTSAHTVRFRLDTYLQTDHDYARSHIYTHHMHTATHRFTVNLTFRNPSFFRYPRVRKRTILEGYRWFGAFGRPIKTKKSFLLLSWLVN